MLLQIGIFLAALVVLLKSADIFVAAAEQMAKGYGISSWMVGLTVVAIGTSLPELGTSIVAAGRGASEVAAGTIIGSNIANIGLVLGLASVIFVFPLKKGIFRKDIIICGGVTVLFLVLGSDGVIGWTEGAVLLVLFGAYIYYLYVKEPEQSAEKAKKFLQEVMKNKNHLRSMENCEKAIKQGLDYKTVLKLKRQGIDVHTICQETLYRELLKSAGLAVLGVIGIALGAKYVVSAAIAIATKVQVSPEVISLSVIALGTSLPELMVTIASARRKLGNILVGNLVGSNIANILLVGGVAAVIAPLQLARFDVWFGLPIALVLVLLLLRFTMVSWFSRVMEGLLWIAIYILFLIGVALFFF